MSEHEEIDEEDLYLPTLRQDAFRRFSLSMHYGHHLSLIGDFLSYQRHPAMSHEAPPEPPVSRREWSFWFADLDFRSWWMEAFPQLVADNEYDLLVLAGLYRSGLARNMAKGQPWAFAETGRFLKDNKDSGDNGDAVDDLLEETRGEDAWAGDAPARGE